ncbi:uncharacterized protein LOC135170030 [Diachasmimorpha longicaudata]|uniref:uncharacterized protein LOC135170030 n=1 Tax=Diachasmimorpha longicaudata TaxID=58733 RepID=UPI0030B87E51
MNVQSTIGSSEQTLRPTTPQPSTAIMSGSVVVTNKTTVVYPINQVKVQTQLSNKARPGSPGVITSAGKLTMIPGNNKITMEGQKACPPGTVTPIIATRIIPQRVPGVQQHTVTTSPSITPQSKIVINNAVTPGQIPITYEAVQVANHQQAAIIQGIQQIQTVPTGTVKTVSSNITGVSNLHRIQNAKAPPVNFQKVKTITSVSNQTAVVSKNLVSRIQVPKSQVANAVHQMTPMTVNQVITNVNNAPRYQPNAMITVQKSQANQRLNPGNSENHQNNKAQGVQQQGQKVVGPPQKAQAISRQSQSQKQMNSLKKGAVTGLQKSQIQNHQGLTNPQASGSVPGGQNRGLSGPGNILKSDNSNSNTQLNVTKASHTAVTVVNKNQTVVQQIVPQGQQQQQIIQKQVGAGQRIQGNVSIQPKVNVLTQGLTSLPMNAKNPTIINAKIQQSPQQMLLRLEPGKSSVGNIQGGVKAIAQKPGNIMKNSPIVGQQSIQRNTTVQPVKIIQQTGQVYSASGFPAQGISQKQPGCIKTIPAQKPQQRGQVQGKTGIKTSLNTNMNTLKTIGNANTTVITQKSSIKTLLPHQQNTSSVVVQKSQPIKIQSTNVQQKQLFIASQFATQQHQQGQQLRQGQIKTILPLTLTPDLRKEMESKGETDSPLAVRDEYENDEEEEIKAVQHSPVRRMPLPYECLQFVLQDHNYGAPPPRTPPPPSPPLKQQPINNGTGPSLPHQSFIYNQGVPITPNTADDAASAISSDAGREVEPEGEETETAPEGEGDEEDSITRCICEFEHDDGYMICCDRCLVWQHVDCMGIDRSNIPDEYLCEICRPRRVDRQRARTLQMRKREELLNSDTSSDTSSTSSADTNVPAPPNPKKRNIQQARKKTETPSQPRRLNNNNNNSESNSNHNSLSTPVNTLPPAPSAAPALDNVSSATGNTTASTNTTSNNTTTNNNNNNNNVTKRPGRREQMPRQSAVQARKKEVVKRGPGKRKGKRRRSTNDEEENQESWGAAVVPLRQWIERYEEAVTNHYSPELRARISSIKVNGTHSDLKQNNNNMSAVASGKCRVNVHSNNVKYLMATMYLPANTPVVELRGKYMLSTQHRPVHHGQGRQHAQRPGPFVFFYRLPREGTEVCVDTRTYGNDARFVRRSCTPNAEVKHCIEKGTLHLYIVTTSAIDKNAEITIRHEQHNLLMSPNSSSTNSVGGSMLPLACACGNPRTCQIASIVVGQVGAMRRSSGGASADNSDGRERRRRGRKNTAPEDDAGVSGGGASVPQAPPTAPSSSSDTSATGTLGATPKRAIETREKPKEEVPQVAQLPPTLADPPAQIPTQTSTGPSDTPPQETKKDKKKMTREERKMEAIMKAFERLEKAEQRKQEVQARNAQRKESGGAQSDNDERDQTIVSHPGKGQKHVERPIRRKRRKGRARTTSTSQSSTRRTRLNSADSDLSSADDDNLPALQSPPLRRPPCSSLSSTGQIYSPTKSETLRDPGNPNPVIPTAADLLLALANSNVPESGRSLSPDRTLQQPALSKSPTCDSGASSSSQSSTPSTPLSSACLLVAAAVGPLAPGFKFPKTKKAMMNEWLRESPDLSQLPPRTLPLVSTIPVSKESPKGSDQLSSDYLNQSMNYGTKSLATLVQAANSVSGICDSPPQRKSVVCGNNSLNSQCLVSSGSAKKRWLRQAISEECDSPNSRRDSPPSEIVAAPPKKRRIARESLSSDNYTPPTTPTPSTGDCALMGTGIGDHSVSMTVENVSEKPAFLSSSSRSLSPTTLERQIKSYLDAEMKEVEPVDMKKSEFYDICKIDKTGEVVEDVPVKADSPQGLDDKLSLSNKMVDIKVDDLIKIELKNQLSEGIKNETMGMDSNQGDIEFKLNIKTELQSKLEVPSLDLNIKVEKTVENTVSGCDKVDEKNIDTGNARVEPNDTETRLEFDNSSTSETGIPSISVSPKKHESLEERSNETSKDEPISLDEFDVEAQMKKITGDDGDDYKEKIETSSERDKSFDGIEGLMESSKEDSGSSDRDDDVEINFNSAQVSGEQGRDVKESENVEERAFKEFETLASLEVLSGTKDIQETSKIESTSAVGTCSSEESMFDSISNLDCESVNESPKIFQSIPPLSERIRKKTENSTAPKKQLDFEAAIIESTIDMESVEMSNGEHKTELSTALRQLLEGKMDQEPMAVNSASPVEKEPGSPPLQHINESPESTSSPEIPNLVTMDVPSQCVDPVLIVAAAITNVPPPPPPPLSPQSAPSVQPEVKRLKDPRTAPHERPPPDAPPPIKRKLSISEYRKRKQQSTGHPTEPEPSSDATSEKSPGRGRSDSASSGTSSLSSDDDSAKITGETAAALTNLSLLTTPDSEERKGGEEGTIGWSAAPTLVERQRENLTERLKREFGLFLSDDEEERARKQGLTAEAILKARKLSSPPQMSLSGAPMTYNPAMAPQLPPQPYIPPPGSAPIHYTPLPGKATSSQQYQNFTTPNPPPTASPSGATNAAKQSPQFLIPQAPPGSNPYPPQFSPTASAAVTTPLFTPTTSPPSTLPPSTPTTPQKVYFSNSHPPARS